MFFANNWETAARSATKFGIPAHESRTYLMILCAKFDLIGQKVRSPGQVKVRCALGDRLPPWRSCCGYSFGPDVFNLSGWDIGYTCLQNVYFGFFILGTSGQQFPTLPIISLWGNYSSAHHFWIKGDRRMQWVAICFPWVPESNDTQYDQLWPDLTYNSKLGERSNF